MLLTIPLTGPSPSSEVASPNMVSHQPELIFSRLMNPSQTWAGRPFISRGRHSNSILKLWKSRETPSARVHGAGLRSRRTRETLRPLQVRWARTQPTNATPLRGLSCERWQECGKASANSSCARTRSAPASQAPSGSRQQPARPRARSIYWTS